MRFPVPQPILSVLSRLEDRGYAAYLVGGCVRDDMLGIRPEEYDIASAARPEEVMACFSGERLIKTGLKHGTVTLLTGSGPVEITTFRNDGTYSDGRHPDSVRFSTDILEDLRRRDFTINAMAYSPARGLMDPYHGREDCALKILRAVGVAEDRFREDALRILRSLRFSATLGFDIEADSYQGMLAMMPRLKNVSQERIARELNLLLVGKDGAKTLATYRRLFFAVLPELEPMLHCPQRGRAYVYDVWEHSLETLRAVDKELPLAWAALLHNSGKPAAMTLDHDGRTLFHGHHEKGAEIAQSCLLRLRQPRKLIDTVRDLVYYHDEKIGPHNLRLWLSRLGFPLLRQLILLQAADLMAHAPHMHQQGAQAGRDRKRQALRGGACLSLKGLRIDGRVLHEMGFPKGPLIGDLSGACWTWCSPGARQTKRITCAGSRTSRKNT